ncbi:MAG TPA: GDSL-type esterase/lipase family protein [Candidatus Eisenbacteria bacterium]|nr:GDSL-type esterase/lipase family protein [Candidatus Eisenbacteria bacterium]
MIPHRIVAVGTSAFFGYGDLGNGGYIERLKRWHEAQDSKNAVFNLGISGATVGETTTQLLERLIPEASRRMPDLLLLTTGINDVRRPKGKESPPVTSPEQFKKNVHEMIRLSRQLTQNIVFISTIPIKEKHDSLDNYLLPEDVKKYASITKNVCEEENIPYLDVYNDWLSQDFERFLFRDGVHSNQEGYQEIFLKLKEFLLIVFTSH